MDNIFNHLNNFEEKEFKAKENGNELNNPYRVNGLLAKVMDDLREYLGCPIIIARSWDDSASKNSQHFLGAVDFYLKTDNCEKWQLSKIKEYLLNNYVKFSDQEIPFSNLTGFGFYLDWKSSKIGFHLDLRGYKARWSRDKEYISFEEGEKRLI